MPGDVPSGPERILVVSDLHLSDFEEHADGWKAHKRAGQAPDEELRVLIESFVAAGTGARHTLVLNGDIFDFDLVTETPQDGRFAVSRSERVRGLLPTAQKSAWKLERMLRDHEGFLRTLARFMAQGHQVVYVLGNHDREFHFPQVQQVLVRALREQAHAEGLGFEEARLRFEPWFYYVPGVLYAEHGQQYDYYSSFRFVLSPVVRTPEGDEIALSMGNLSNRYMVSQMGYFNPHASDFILNVFRYFAHWLRFYAFTRRNLVVNWFWGSLLVVGRLLSLKAKMHRRPADYDALMAEAARRAGLPLHMLRALSRLHRAPITMRFYRILREFWIDRLIVALVMIAVTLALAVAPVPLWAKLMVPLSTLPLLYFVYESLARGETIFTAEHEIPRYAEAISGLLGTRVVTFGHTHKPRVVPLGRNSAFVDTGTWAPMTPGGADDSASASGFRNYLTIEAVADRVSYSLGSWMPVPEPRRELVRVSRPVALPRLREQE